MAFPDGDIGRPILSSTPSQIHGSSSTKDDMPLVPLWSCAPRNDWLDDVRVLKSESRFAESPQFWNI